MKKDWSAKMGERDELIEKIHDAGISIYSTFVFGLDHDTPETFKQAVDFAKGHGFYYAAFNHITPFPGTPLYEQLKQEDRLITEKWWMDTTYRYGYLPFHPKKMTYLEVTDMCANSRRDFFKTSMILKRWRKLFSRNKNLLLSYIFLTSNMMIQREVEERLELPIGINLDEMPK